MVIDQKITDDYAIYNGDSCEVLPTLKDESVHISIYSPPFYDVFQYSSSDNDLSNCRNYEQFFEHYEFIVKEIHRLLIPGRLAIIHCMDIKKQGIKSAYRDFPGDIIRLHERIGFYYQGRHCVWKEPLRVAIRTRAQGLMHRQIVNDSSLCHAAGADYILIFRKTGNNPAPIEHPIGLSKYAGLREIPQDLLRFKGSDDPKTNKLSHWIWQQYASAFWDDVRTGNVLPFKEARECDEEKHACPLQLDVIERCIALYSNPGEILLTPFMGVGSEVFCAIRNGLRGIGVELKPSYFRQAQRNIEHAKDAEQNGLFDNAEEEDDEAE